MEEIRINHQKEIVETQVQNKVMGFVIIHMIFFILAFILATIADKGYNSTKRIVDRFFLSFFIPPVMVMYSFVIFIDKLTTK